MKIVGHEITLRKVLIWFIVTGILGGLITNIFVPSIWLKIKERFGSKPYVAVLISRNAIDFGIPQDFLDGFDGIQKAQPQEYLKSNDGLRVQIYYKEDFLNEEKSTEICRKLISDKNCILVVGNANSTLTNSNLEVFMASRNKLPLILPIATNSDLLKRAENSDYKAILRMLPHNGQQAQQIERLVSKLAPTRKVAIFGDEENRSYSENLSRDIADQIRKKGGHIIAEELIGPTNSFYRSGKATIENSNPEVIVYVGVSHHGSLLLDQLRELNISIPIIFTDGCLVSSLIIRSQNYPGKSFILSPAEFREEGLLKPSYNPIGIDAYTLVSSIIAKTDGTREGVYEHIAKNKKELAFLGKAGRYEFDAIGENEARNYFVYEMKQGRLVPFINF